jgi:hypothetical protein
MSAKRPVVFLIDVDNTLLDNDRIAADRRSARHTERSSSTMEISGMV